MNTYKCIYIYMYIYIHIYTSKCDPAETVYRALVNLNI